MARYDIRQVTRYVLVRKPATEFAGADMDVAEFRRHDEALKALRVMNAAQQDPCIKINGDIAITLSGIEVLDTRSALDLLEARVTNAKRVWRHRAENLKEAAP